MNTMRTLLLTLALALASNVPAFAVDTTKTYSSGLLIGIFLAFCALIVVVQLAPSIMLLIGFVKGLAQRSETRAEVQRIETPSA
jgi:hypothetical protein